MKFFRLLFLSVISLSAFVFSGCAEEELPDNRELDYGYVQFRLYKETSYNSPDSKAVTSQLDYLADACKIGVSMLYGEQTITQTLVLNAADASTAEYGLRSEKLQLLKGEYEIVSFTLYDANDETLYTDAPSASARTLSVVAGGMVEHGLTVNVTPRGYVKFTIEKNIDRLPITKAQERPSAYLFEQIAYLTVEVENTANSVRRTYEMLPAEFSIHFADNGDDTDGVQTSTVVCDSIISIEAGDYRVYSYQVFDEDQLPLEFIDLNDSDFKTSTFTVEDNSTADATVYVTLYESDAYLRDNYILREIWYALDGPNWSYTGQTYTTGTNWDFNKDPDLWSYQPGVQVHPNGRIAYIDMSGFGIKGALPESIGELSELMELMLGTHSDDQQAVTRSMSVKNAASHFYTAKSDAEKEAERKAYAENYSAIHYTPYQMSPICALALRQHGLTSSAASSYDGMTEEQLFLEGAKTSGGNSIGVKPMDVAPGVMFHGLVSIPPQIGNLKRLEKLNIANCPIVSLGEAEPTEDCPTPGIGGLTNLTDLEIYNCPNIDKLPDLSALSKLITLNLSYVVSDEHPDLPSDLPDGYSPLEESEVRDALVTMSQASNGVARSLQSIYCNGNHLTEFPSEMKDFADLAVIDFANNEITTLPRMGMEFDPSTLQLSNNRISGFTGEGEFCNVDLLSSITLANNELTEFPDIFRPKAEIQISTVDLSNNKINGFPDLTLLPDGEDFLYVETLNLGGNTIKTFPEDFFNHCEVDYIIMSACGLTEIPEGAFEGKYSESLVSLDLQYNRLTTIPLDFNATTVPYLYGVDVSFNAFTAIPDGVLSCKGLTILGIRGQRTDSGERCFREWPSTLYQHTGMRAFYAGANDIRTVPAEQVSTSIWYLEIADNPNIYFDASGICSAWSAGQFFLYYDRSQNIINCEAMLQ